MSPLRSAYPRPCPIALNIGLHPYKKKPKPRQSIVITSANVCCCGVESSDYDSDSDSGFLIRRVHPKGALSDPVLKKSLRIHFHPSHSTTKVCSVDFSDQLSAAVRPFCRREPFRDQLPLCFHPLCLGPFIESQHAIIAFIHPPAYQ
ncbi:hypothetical protein CGRA01v4_08396 [Colletotrichum graminicola]|nr:hypothetical protein CGRA01v4_08396 [Colletotrichum graminicola]